MFIIGMIIGILVGIIIPIIALYPKTKTIQQDNSEIISQRNSLSKEVTQLQNEKEKLSELTQQLKESNSILENQAETVYNKSLEAMQEKLSNTANIVSQKYQEYEDEVKNEYLELLSEKMNLFKKAEDELNIRIQDTTKVLQNLQNKVNAAVEASKREQSIKDKNNFYKLNLSDIDVKEIKKLREITPYLRDSKPLNKVIWKVYYEHPYSALIGRVVGVGKHTGIYKITNLINGMCYIGQSVDIAERFRQHIKRGIGADEPTKNKLYPAMLTFGVENFSFEVIEECPVDELNKQEKYWIEYFHGKDYGYNVTGGNK